MVAPKHGFPLVRVVVLVCSYDDLGTLGIAGDELGCAVTMTKSRSEFVRTA
jgi:hypothetical protein